jgi:predicted lipoprotein with Yx(FWY)xxD motif
MSIRRAATGSALAVTLLLVGCGGDDDTTEPPVTTAAQQDASATATSPTSPTTAAAAADVNVESSSLGQILVDAEGMTLYVFLDDTAGTSTCVDACAQTWPPLVASEVSVGAGLDEGSFSLIGRPDGTRQLAVGDRPLYLFAGDVEPGDTAGQGFNDVWYVVGPDGEPIEET